MTFSRIVFAALTTLPLPAMAEQNWQYTGTFYGWLPGISTTVETQMGDVEADIEFSDILEKLDFAFLAALEARKGRLALVGDFQYFDLGADASPGTAAIETVDIDSDVKILAGYALYDVSKSSKTRIELGGGVRFYDASFDTGVSGTTPLSLSSEGNWADAVVSARIKHKLSEDWFMTAYADVGGFGIDGSSDLTWQAYIAAGYRLSDSWTAVGGFRHLMFERDFNGRMVTSDVGGPVIGLQKAF